MRGEIITIGEELLCGRVMNLNAWYAAGRLSAMGFHVSHISTVGDRAEDVARVLEQALSRSDFLIVTGGLGTTDDDITTKTVAELFNRPLNLDRSLLDHIKRMVEKQNLSWSEALEKLAWLPKGAELMEPEPTACGYFFFEQGRPIFFLPGVPQEMQVLLDKCIMPRLLELSPHHKEYISITFKLFGIREYRVGALLKDLDLDFPNLVVGYYPNFPEVHVVLTVRGDDRTDLESLLARAEKTVEARIGQYIMARNDETLEQVVGKLLTANNLTLALAESCTGGLIAHRLTEVPGSSEYFERGFVVYSDQSKKEQLNVPAKLLTDHGAVSAEVAKSMAQGVREVSKAGLGLAVTGIAGPTGATPGKPVGTVHIALATGRDVASKRYRFSGRRDEVKQLSAYTALTWVRRYLKGDPFFHRL